MANLPQLVDKVEHDQLCAELESMGFSKTEAQSMVDAANMAAQDVHDEYEEQETDRVVEAESARDEHEAAYAQTFHLNPPGAGGLEYDPYF